jgi:hypothetical protein
MVVLKILSAYLHNILRILPNCVIQTSYWRVLVSGLLEEIFVLRRWRDKYVLVEEEGNSSHIFGTGLIAGCGEYEISCWR